MEKHKTLVIKSKHEMLEYIDKFVKSERGTPLKKFIEETSFSTDPASIRYHNAVHGGLLMHCLNIIKVGLKLNNALGFGLSEESIVVCSILHDYCKVGTYKIGSRKVQDPLYANDRTRGYGWRSVNKYEYQKATDIPYGHGVKSMMLVFKNFGYDYLNDSEQEAVAYHMGMFEEPNSNDCMEVFAKNRLAYIIHIADTTAGLYHETAGENPDLVF